MKTRVKHAFMMITACLLVVSGCTSSNHSQQTITPISLTERENEIADLSFAFLLGYEFQDLGEATISINLIHDGKIIQNYENLLSYEDNSLKKLWIGFEPIDGINYNILLQQENELIISKGRIDSDLKASNESDTVTHISYKPKKLDINQKSIALGALCLSTNGVTTVDNDALFNTENISDMQELYQSLSQQTGYEYCYIIELHH